MSVVTLNNGLSKRNRVVLNRFRLQLINDINIRAVLDHLCIFSNFPLEVKTSILSLSSKFQQNAALLDRLELFDDSVFMTFLGAQREHNVKLYSTLSNALLTMDLPDVT